jgi:4-hydroxyacetophenone monooxygenase
MQGRYALSCFKTLIETGKKSIEIRPEAYEDFNNALDKELDMSIWLDPRQKSYYQNEFGRSATNAPWKVMQLWTAWRKPNLDHYKIS